MNIILRGSEILYIILFTVNREVTRMPMRTASDIGVEIGNEEWRESSSLRRTGCNGRGSEHRREVKTE